MRKRVKKSRLSRKMIIALALVVFVVLMIRLSDPQSKNDGATVDPTEILDVVFLPNLENELDRYYDYAHTQGWKLELVNLFTSDKAKGVDGLVFESKWQRTFQARDSNGLKPSNCPNVLDARDIGRFEDQSLRGQGCTKIVEENDSHGDVYYINRILPSQRSEVFFVADDTFVAIEFLDGPSSRSGFEKYFERVDKIPANEVNKYIEANKTKMAETNFEKNQAEAEEQQRKDNAFQSLSFTPMLPLQTPEEFAEAQDYEIIGKDPLNPELTSASYRHKNGQGIGVYSAHSKHFVVESGRCGPTPRAGGTATDCQKVSENLWSSERRGKGNVSRYTYSVFGDTAVVTVLTIWDKEKDTTRQDVLDEMSVLQDQISRSLEFVDATTFSDAKYVEMDLIYSGRNL